MTDRYDVGSGTPAPCAQCGIWMPRPRTWYLGRPCCRGCLAKVVVETKVDTSWIQNANCAGSEIDFYPEVDSKTNLDIQRLMCRSCQVQSECLTYAIKMRESHGIWGGMTTMERWDFAKRSRLPVFREHISE